MAQALGAGNPSLGNAVTHVVDLGLRCELTEQPRHVLTLRSVIGDFTAQDIGISITRLAASDAR